MHYAVCNYIAHTARDYSSYDKSFSLNYPDAYNASGVDAYIALFPSSNQNKKSTTLVWEDNTSDCYYNRVFFGIISN